MEQRTGAEAQRLRVRGSGAVRVGVVVDDLRGAAKEQEAAARVEVLRHRPTTVRLREGLRCGLARRGVGDLGGARRTGGGVGRAENVAGCTRMRMHVRREQHAQCNAAPMHISM